MKCVTPLPGAAADLDEDDAFGDGHTLALDRPDAFAHTMLEAGRTRSAFTDHALREGTLIEGFRIVRPIGEGGFGIVYLAWDGALERHVAIKEYMPSSLAMRVDASSGVSMRSERDRDTFDAGLKSFVNEARLLARFDHPALVKVFRFWEANRTAYMAMPYYEGPTLKAALADIEHPVPEEKLREWLLPLLDALSAMHREQCYHRDVSPDNILLTTAGPVLLDFGAARRVISDRTQALTTMLKPGFAPIEQYGGAMMQGPWTDLYALAGVLYYAITGRPPLASVARVVNDTLRPLAQTHAGRYREGFLRAIDAALAVRPEARPQDVQQFRALLDAGLAPAGSPVVSVPAAVQAVERSEDRAPATTGASTLPGPPVVSAASRQRGRGVYGWAAAAVAVLVAGGALWWPSGHGTSASTVVPVKTAAPAPTPAPPTLPVAVVPPTAPVPLAAAAHAPATAPVLVATPTPSASPSPTPAATPVRRAVLRAASSNPAIEHPKPTPVSVLASESRRPARAEAEVVPSYTEGGKPPRCGDLVLKSSLEPLNPDEVTYLNNKCK